MKEQLEILLTNWLDPKTRDAVLLNKIYSEIKGITLDKCPKCKAKAITELRKYYELHFNIPEAEANSRKYILKPGNHQFISGEASIHNNENTTDKSLEMYLKAYPYIKSLFIKMP
ncbi:MAG: hypothetical protein JWQ57_2049 [Mucilaginibacter sp.]|nr:hypothetical protein [Mucilaginibacter sp.]